VRIYIDKGRAVPRIDEVTVDEELVKNLQA
jgi:hypothetical protein